MYAARGQVQQQALFPFNLNCVLMEKKVKKKEKKGGTFFNVQLINVPVQDIKVLQNKELAPSHKCIHLTE